MINKENWEKEFDRLADRDKCLPKETLLKTDEHKGYGDGSDFEHYPESPYELDNQKVKEFIKELLKSVGPA